MNNSHNIVQITNDKTYRELYEQQSNEVEYLKKFIGDASIQKIKNLESLTPEIKRLQSIIDEKQQTIDLLREQLNKKVQAAVINREHQLNSEHKTQMKNQKYNTQEKVIKPLQKENEELKITNEQLMKEIQEIKVIVSNNQDLLNKIIEILLNSSNIKTAKEEVITLIKNEGLGIKPTQDEKVIIANEIKALMDEGLTQKEIADRLMKTSKYFSHLKSLQGAQNKVSRYIKKITSDN